MILNTFHAQKKSFICEFFPGRKSGVVLIGAEKRRALKRLARRIHATIIKVCKRELLSLFFRKSLYFCFIVQVEFKGSRLLYCFLFTLYVRFKENHIFFFSLTVYFPVPHFYTSLNSSLIS